MAPTTSATESSNSATHCAAGKAPSRSPAAHSSRAIQNNLLEAELDELTPRTMTDPEKLRERFADIRADGYAWVFEEFTMDINSVAAPITDSSGRTNLAVHVHGPAFRFPQDIDLDELGSRVAATAQRIEAQLLSA